MSEPWYWVPVLVMSVVLAAPRRLLLRLDELLRLPPEAEPPLLATFVLVALLAEANPLAEELPRLADEPPLREALRPPPELFDAVLAALRLADERPEEDPRLAELLLALLRLLEEPPLFEEDFEAPAFLAVDFFAAAFLGAAFFAAVFFAAAF